MRKIFKVILSAFAVTLVFSLFGNAASADEYAGWVNNGNGTWSYVLSDGSHAEGWQKVGNLWYYFENGIMKEGWLNNTGKWFYLAKGSGYMVTGWQKISGEWYYFSQGGQMLTGWQKIEGEWYYFSSAGNALKGWNNINGDYYYFAENCKMCHDTTVDGLTLESSGRVKGVKKNTDVVTSKYELRFVAYMDRTDDSPVCSYGRSASHISGYSDPEESKGSFSISGWTWVYVYDYLKNTYTIMRAEEFDAKTYKDGGYGSTVQAYFGNRPGELVLITFTPDDEYNEFLGWSRSEEYNKSGIISSKHTICAQVEDSGFCYAHNNSSWTGCFVDVKFVNNNVNQSPNNTTGIIHHIPCIRSDNGTWIISPELSELVGSLAFYSVYWSYYKEEMPDGNYPRYYDFCMRSENADFSDYGVYLEMAVDEYGFKTGTVYKVEYIEDSGKYILRNPDGTIRNRLSYYGEGKIYETDALTGSYVRTYYDQLLAARVERIPGWIENEEKWYYYNADKAEFVTGWLSDNGHWYYFDASGVMQTGWQQVGSKWYCFAPGGSMLTGWQQLGGKWYYFSGSGDMLTGWVKTGGYWYYLQASGEMFTGWYLSGNTWYYFAPGGQMVTGKYTVNGKEYFFDSDGKCTDP